VSEREPINPMDIIPDPPGTPGRNIMHTRAGQWGRRPVSRRDRLIFDRMVELNAGGMPLDQAWWTAASADDIGIPKHIALRKAGGQLPPRDTKARSLALLDRCSPGATEETKNKVLAILHATAADAVRALPEIVQERTELVKAQYNELGRMVDPGNGPIEQVRAIRNGVRIKAAELMLKALGIGVPQPSVKIDVDARGGGAEHAKTQERAREILKGGSYTVRRIEDDPPPPAPAAAPTP
jgi:hypothetical protein